MQRRQFSSGFQSGNQSRSASCIGSLACSGAGDNCFHWGPYYNTSRSPAGSLAGLRMPEVRPRVLSRLEGSTRLTSSARFGSTHNIAGPTRGRGVLGGSCAVCVSLDADGKWDHAAPARWLGASSWLSGASGAGAQPSNSGQRTPTAYFGSWELEASLGLCRALRSAVLLLRGVQCGDKLAWETRERITEGGG